MKKHFLLFAALACLAAGCAQAPECSMEERIDEALSQMTLEEKVAILHAQSRFSSAGVPRLGIPEIWCSDGPHGVRAELQWDDWNQAGWTNDSCVAFPSLSCLAATWDRDLAYLYGKALGEEARYREKDVILGPGLNICRTPLGGRNFEYMGEDPLLAGKMGAEYVKGVQSNGVAACVKHFALNNEETWREELDVDLSDRALYEIYLPAFKMAALEGGAWSFMASYNLVRGRHVGQDTLLTRHILKDEWGWDGAVLSDWGAAYDTDEAVDSGMDLEFGTWSDIPAPDASLSPYRQFHLSDPYLERLRDGRADTALLDDRCRRVLRLNLRTASNPDKPAGCRLTQDHYDVARRVVSGGAVLLKNDGEVLPVGKSVRKIAVVGENAIKMMTVGGGSSSLKAQHEILPLDAIRARAEADGISVTYARGYVGDIINTNDGVTTGQDLRDARSAGELLAEAVALASEADLVLYVGGLNKSRHQDCEGVDREEYGLPYGQDALIAALAQANPKIAVLLVSGNPVAMPWVESVPSILQVWYGGSEAGHGIADVVFGDVNPSGKLPFTYPAKLSDSPAHREGMEFPARGKKFYDEGIFVGYRWYEKEDIAPLFAFGHGLSYTSFEYSGASIWKGRLGHGGNAKVSLYITNTGTRDGAEVVQLYISDSEASVERPVKELKAFRKVFLKAGESEVVTFEITEDMLQFFDETAHCWKTEPGEFVVSVGSASDDIRSSCTFVL